MRHRVLCDAIAPAKKVEKHRRTLQQKMHRDGWKVNTLEAEVNVIRPRQPLERALED